MRYLFSTPDGKLTVLLSIGYLGWAILELAAPGTTLRNCGWDCNSTLFMMPILLIVVFMRQRLGTKEEDRSSVLFGALNVSLVAMLPPCLWMMAHGS
jgi:hypothetical protein